MQICVYVTLFDFFRFHCVPERPTDLVAFFYNNKNCVFVLFMISILRARLALHLLIVAFIAIFIGW